MHGFENDPDEAYHRYVWGEASARAYARRSRVTGPKTVPARLQVQVDPAVDGTDLVSP